MSYLPILYLHLHLNAHTLGNSADAPLTIDAPVRYTALHVGNALIKRSTRIKTYFALIVAPFCYRIILTSSNQLALVATNRFSFYLAEDQFYVGVCLLR